MGYTLQLRLAAWLLVACALVFLRTAAGQDDQSGNNYGTDLSCAVTIWGNQDYEWNITSIKPSPFGPIKNYTSHCIAAVKLARERCGGKSLNFVITHFWKYTSDKGDPGRFCYKTNKGDDQVAVQCTDLVTWYPQNKTVAEQLIWRFYKGMKGCFITAIWEGFEKIKITPHLDDGTGQGGWRNVLRLHPSKKLEGYSYADVMLTPIARALNESIVATKSQNKTQVYFTLQGEMNLALAAYPLAWKQTVDEVRWMLAGDDATRKANIKVGVSMNFNKLCGSFCWGGSAVTTAAVDPDVLKAIDMDAYKELLNYVDFLGISNYPKLGDGAWNMETAANDLSGEMAAAFGFSLKDFIDLGKEFHLSEFGIGGGGSNCGCQVAANKQELADFTFFGMFGVYGHYPDPWSNPEYNDFRREFYKRAVKWLANKGGPTFRVDGAFIWSMSSWDVAGLYWTSTNEKGSYYDKETMDMIKDWNDNRKLPN